MSIFAGSQRTASGSEGYAKQGTSAAWKLAFPTASPSRPSREDIRLAYDPKASYLILSLMEEIPVLHSFHVENGEVCKEFLEIRDEGEATNVYSNAGSEK